MIWKEAQMKLVVRVRVYNEGNVKAATLEIVTKSVPEPV